MSDIKKPKVKATIPPFDGQAQNFHIWKVQFASYLNLMRLSYYLNIPEIKPDDKQAAKNWELDNADFFGILQLALDSKTAKEIINLQDEPADGTIPMNGSLCWRLLNELLRSKSILRLVDLETNLSNLQMIPGEHPTEFISRLKEVMHEIERIQNEKSSELKAVTYILKKLTPEYQSFVIGQAATPARTVTQLAAQLIEVYNYLKPQQQQKQQQVQTSTEQAFVTMLKQHLSSEIVGDHLRNLQIQESSNYTSTYKPSRGGYGHRGRGKFYNNKNLDPCHYCGIPGHKKFTCDKRKRDIQNLDKKQYEQTVTNKSSNTSSDSNYKCVNNPPTQDDWTLNPQIASECFNLLNCYPSFDLCATAQSTKAPFFFTREDDALSQKWEKHHNYYLNPPFRKAGEFFSKAQKEEVKGVCIFPLWEKEEWLHLLLQNITSPIIILPALTTNIFTNPTVKTKNKTRMPKWEAAAATFDFSRTHFEDFKEKENLIFQKSWSDKLLISCYQLQNSSNTPQQQICKPTIPILENKSPNEDQNTPQQQICVTKTSTFQNKNKSEHSNTPLQQICATETLSLQNKNKNTPQQHFCSISTSTLQNKNKNEHHNNFLIDSAATSSMTNNPQDVKCNFKPLHNTYVSFGNNTHLQASGKGDAVLHTHSQEGEPILLNLPDTLHVPGLSQKLLSVPKAVQAGASFHFTPNGSHLEMNGKNIQINLQDNLFKLDVEDSSEETHHTTTEILHERLGHPGRDNAQAFNKNQRQQLLSHTPNCSTCNQTKSKRKPFKRKPKNSKQLPLHRVFTDTSGRFKVEGWNGETCLQVVVDQASGVTTVEPLQSESQVHKGLNSFLTSFGKPKIARSDGASVFKSQFATLCKQYGIAQEFTVPDTSQQNGVAERTIGTVTQLTRSLLKQRNTPTFFWPYAAKTAAHLLNIRPRATLNNRVPLQILHAQKPKPVDTSYLRVFGCLCYIHLNPKDRLHGKLDKTAHSGIFLGYADHQKAYIAFDIERNQVVTSRDITFIEEEEGALHLPERLQKEARNTPIFGEITRDSDYQPSHDSEDELTSPNSTYTPPTITPLSPLSSAESTPTTTPISSPITSRNSLPALPQTTQEQHTQGNIPDSSTPLETDRRYPLRTRNPPKPFWLADVELSNHTTTTQPSDDPKTVKQAMKSTHHREWQLAMEKELLALTDNNTWKEITKQPTEANIISCKWVFRTKLDQNGNTTQHKARLVARGFSQIPGQDFNQTFAPVTRLSTIRLLCALSAIRGYALKQMDAKAAYLNAEIQEELYIDLPEGYTPQNPDTQVLKLNKALYGLKQAGREWNQLLTSYLQKHNEWEQCPYEPCLFKKKPNTSKGDFFLAVFVDDFTGAVQYEEDWKSFTDNFQDHFQLSANGDLEWILGINVCQDRTKQTVSLSQKTYIDQMLAAFNMKDCHATFNPITTSPPQPDKSPYTTQEYEWASKTPYQNLVGALIYASRSTRPDINFAVHHAARSNTSYRSSHWKSAKRTLSYLKHTQNASLTYHNTNSEELIGYADSDWASDSSDRKSVYGYIFFLAGAPVTWKTKKQESVALSTCEAEYYAMCEAAQEATYLRNVLTFLNCKIPKPTTVYIDNKSAIALSQNPIQHTRAKHIDIRFHYNREAQQKGIVSFISISSKENIADLLTKPMPTARLEEFRNKMNLQRSINCDDGVEGECER